MKRRFLIIASSLTSFFVLFSGPGHASDSLWADLEAVRALEPLCPTEVKGVLGDLSLSDIDEPIRISRRRETEVTTKVKTYGDFPGAERAMHAYLEIMKTQTRDAVAKVGCGKAMARLNLPGGRPLAFDLVMRAAKELPLSTERTEQIPVAERIGTAAAYPLQRTLMRVATASQSCKPDAIKVMRLGKRVLETPQAPPFLGFLVMHEERWEIVCEGVQQILKVRFQQDARRWRSYSVAGDNDQPAEMPVSAERRPLFNGLRAGVTTGQTLASMRGH